MNRSKNASTENAKLAIVIPAFKIMYFEKCLESIANQTIKNFTLYIGNDGSHNDFESLIEKYSNKINIVYHRFKENLGGKDLVSHWERCIDLVDGENWIWLFSDDDFMDHTCVENFFRLIDRDPGYDLFHFNVKKVDEFNHITVTQFSPFPELLSVEDFLLGNFKMGYYSTAIEYIFRKSHFYNQGRVQNFDLAWCADTATWIKLGRRNGIRTIESSNVYWRESKLNISSSSEKEILKRKFYAQIEFANWICKQAKENEIHFEIMALKKRLITWCFRDIRSRIKFLSFGLIAPLVSKLYLNLYEKKPPKQKILFLYNYKIYVFSKRMIKNILFQKIFFKVQKLK